MIIRIIIYGWWFQPTPLKNDGVKVSWDDERISVYGKIKLYNVPNHQPVIVVSKHLRLRSTIEYRHFELCQIESKEVGLTTVTTTETTLRHLESTRCSSNYRPLTVMDLEDGRSCFLVDVARGSDLASFRGPGWPFRGWFPWKPLPHLWGPKHPIASVIWIQ